MWLLLILSAPPLQSTPPSLYLTISPTRVLVHFDTDANRKYELQYTDLVVQQANGSIGPWSNLFVVPSLPTPDHFIIPEMRTNQHRLYRLRVTP